MSGATVKKGGFLKTLSRKELFSYAMGGVGSNMMFHLIGTFLMFFLTDMYGISPMTVGKIFLVTRIIDAFTDPLFGMVTDMTRSKLGRYRPYLIFGAPFLGLSITMLFWAPDLSTEGKVVFAYIAYIFYSFTSTVINVPYHGLTPVMTSNYEERTLVVAMKQGLGIVATMIATALPLLMVEWFGGGIVGWRTTGAIMGAFVTVMFWICAFGAKKRDTLEFAQQTRGADKISPKLMLKLVGSNKPLLALVTAHATNIFGFAMETSIAIYFFKYYLMNEALFPMLKGVGSFIPMIMMLSLPILGRMFSKKGMFLAGSWVGMLICVVAYLLAPYLPVWLMFGMLLVSMVSNMFAGNLTWVLIPDCTEYGEYKTGINANGLTTAIMTFVAKCSSALAGLLTGWALTHVNYVPNQVQPQEVLDTILILKFLTVAFAHGCSILAMRWYYITPDFYNKIISELKARREANKSVTATTEATPKSADTALA
ncbi:MAG: MFS transporter [Endozoicomonas sp.]